MPTPESESPASVTPAEALRFWVRLGFISFGGPAGQIAIMHQELVERRRWLSETTFLHALNFCMLLPGPEAQQLAAYIGWKLHGIRGGIAAGVLFVAPGALIVLGLSMLYAGLHEVSLVQALFFGIKAAVLAIVIEAVVRIGRRALRNGLMIGIAAAGFIAIFLYRVPFPLVILGAAAVGLAGSLLYPGRFVAAGGDGKTRDSSAAEPATKMRTPGQNVRLIAAFLLLWLAPTAVLVAMLGPQNAFAQQGLFFSKMAVVTFGGAYAVLAYVSQQAVDSYGWLAPGEMLDGLGLAETTPGPLILVVQFVGFLAAYRNPGALDPMLAGTLGALLTTWVTFVPCFLWVFLGAPYIERLHRRTALSAGLSAITAAVVGVILNLAVWFGLHVLFGEVGERKFLGMTLYVPDWSTLNAPAAVLAAGALIAMLRFRVPMVTTLAASALLGAVVALWLP